MKSKKSFCNIEIITNDVKRFWPLWTILFIGLQVMYMLPFLSVVSGSAENAQTKRTKIICIGLGKMYDAANPFMIAVLAAIAAVLVFGYLFKKRETYMLHSFPVTRGVQFCSHFLSGFLMVLLPYFITYLLIGFFTTVLGGIVLAPMAGFMAETLIMILFFYALACLVVVLSGSAAISATIYAVLNGLVSGFMMLLTEGASVFLNNVLGGESILMSEAVQNFLYWVTPVSGCNNILRNGIMKVYGVGSTYERSVFGISFVRNSSWAYALSEEMPKNVNIMPWQTIGRLSCYLIPAILFLVFAYFLYQRRELERVGDTLAFPWEKAVFHWVFSMCGSFVFVAIIDFVDIDSLKESMGSYRNLFWLGMVFLVIGCVVSFIISNMIIQKTFRVWKSISAVQLGVSIVCVMAVFLFARYDCYHRALPDVKDVQEMQIRVSDSRANDTGGINVGREEEIKEILQTMQDLADKAEDMQVSSDEDEESLWVEIFCDMGNKTEEMRVDCLGYQENKKHCDRFFAVLDNKDSMMEKIFGEDYENLQEGDYDFYFLDEDKMLEYADDVEMDDEASSVDDKVLKQHRKEVFQALQEDVKAGSISFDVRTFPEEDDRQEIVVDSKGRRREYVSPYGRSILMTDNCTKFNRLLKEWNISEDKPTDS